MDAGTGFYLYLSYNNNKQKLILPIYWTKLYLVKVAQGCEQLKEVKVKPVARRADLQIYN